MPSRDLPVTPPPVVVHRQTRNLAAPLVGGISAAVLLIIVTICFWKLYRKTTAPSDSGSSPPFRFSYSVLRRATSKFDPSLRLGQGGFGSVYSGTLRIPSSESNVPVAVKLMDSGSLQGEREFQNELFFAGKIDSKYIISVVGFSSDPKRRRMLLVYELMANGSLQHCLLHRKCSELKNWEIRFSIALDIAKGLEYLHHFCDPPVIHGDIKPSNVLLDANFNAKIGDFGLARVKTEDHVEIEVKKEQTLGSEGNVVEDKDKESLIEETESVITANGLEEFHGGVDRSPESFASPETMICAQLSPETPVVSPGTVPFEEFDKASVSEGNFDRFSVENGKETSDKKKKNKKVVSGNDWWWKQAESGPVKDYVMEWIGNEIKEERPTSEWIGASSVGKTEKKKRQKRLDWWVSLDDHDNKTAKKEWWKEEYCEELARKKKKQGSDYWPRDDKKNKRSRSKSSVDWRNSYDLEVPRSGVSSTPSMRGTVCYVAPEYGVHGSEKCDVYSYGVVLLVLIAGRRPLQVTASPMSVFQRANLLSWSRNLARAGKLLDLVDQSVEFVNKEEALVCIKVALLCLQKLPARRPSMKQVVGMLTGDLEPPKLPTELSPSHLQYKSCKKAR